MMRLPWRAGASTGWKGPVYVIATRFTYQQVRHMPLVYWHGLRLRHGWPRIEGAIGLSIMTDLATRSTYTLSVWRSPEDMHRWVRCSDHARLMRGYRPLLASSAADGWLAETFNLRTAWCEALKRVGAGIADPAANQSGR
jgi:hypothetical protein